MTIELMRAAPAPLDDFVIDGKPVFSRSMPLRLAMKLNDDSEVEAEVMAEIIMACVVDESGEATFSGVDAILEGDFNNMVKLFAAISGGAVSPQEAAKNS